MGNIAKHHRINRFIHEAVIEAAKPKPNYTQAAVRAGYAPKTAGIKASQLLATVIVREAMEKAMAKAAKKVEITQERVLGELALLAFSDLTHYVVDPAGNVSLTPDAPKDAMRALQSIRHRVTTSGQGEKASVTHDVELKLWDKPGPLRLAGRHVGLSLDKPAAEPANPMAVNLFMLLGQLPAPILGELYARLEAASKSDGA